MGHNETVRLGAAPVHQESGALHDGERLVRVLLPAVAVGVAYYAGCIAGFALRFPQSGISFFWPPTAVLAAALLVAAPRSWTSFLIAAFIGHAIAHARDGIPVSAWPIQFAGNAAQATLAAWIVRRYSTTDAMFTNVRGVLVFLVGACVAAPAIASVLPSYVYVLLGWASDFGTAWRARVISNAIASLTLIPSLVVCWRYVTDRPPVNPRRVIEFAALLLGLLLTTAAITNIDRSDAIGLSLALYGPAPLLLWATVRFGGTGLAFALLWTTLFTIYTALQGRGPLAGGTPADTVVGVQLLLTANAVPMMLMAGLLGQNRARHRALHHAQQRFALATTAGGIGIWELQVATGEFVVADNVDAILGYRPEEVGRQLDDWLKLIVDADREDVLVRLTSLTSGTSDSFDAEFRVTHKDGSIRWLTARGGATETRDGVPVRVLGTYADITERKESARALLEANDALVRTGRIAAMAAFSASIAHELSQPLTGIATNTSACLRWVDGTGPLPRLRLHNALDDVLNDCRRAAHIVERTHAMFSNRPTEKQHLDLNLILRDILDAVHARVRESGVRVRVRADRDLPTVLGDPVQMQQVVLNLVINAIDAMRETVSQRRLLELRTRRSRRFAVVSVRDNGTGLQADDRRRLFDPFFTTKTGGTGMGLTISRSIVDSHGGSLWAVSNVDRGMTFRFKVPIADPTHPS